MRGRVIYQKVYVSESSALLLALWPNLQILFSSSLSQTSSFMPSVSYAEESLPPMKVHASDPSPLSHPSRPQYFMRGRINYLEVYASDSSVWLLRLNYLADSFFFFCLQYLLQEGVLLITGYALDLLSLLFCRFHRSYPQYLMRGRATDPEISPFLSSLSRAGVSYLSRNLRI